MFSWSARRQQCAGAHPLGRVDRLGCGQGVYGHRVHPALALASLHAMGRCIGNGARARSTQFLGHPTRSPPELLRAAAVQRATARLFVSKTRAAGVLSFYGSKLRRRPALFDNSDFQPRRRDMVLFWLVAMGIAAACA
jgi:hypothetical protein